MQKDKKNVRRDQSIFLKENETGTCKMLCVNSHVFLVAGMAMRQGCEYGDQQLHVTVNCRFLATNG